MFGAGTSILLKIYQKYLQRFEVWCCRSMENIIWADCMKNKYVLRKVREESNKLNSTK